MAQFKAWASQRFPRATLVTEGLDLKAWNRIALILDGLASDWPGVANELGWITTKHALWEDDPQGAIAAAESVFGEKIAFNPFFFVSSRRIVRVLSLGEKTGLYPVGAKRAGEWFIVSHEWGHLVYAWLRRHELELWRKLIAIFAVDPADPRSQFDQDKGAAISLYAKRGITEAFAFSLIQWRERGHWPQIVREFSRSLGGEP